MTGFVEFDGSGDNARLLLAVAELLGHPADVVRTNSDGFFEVPDDVLDGYRDALSTQVEAKTTTGGKRRTRR